MNMRHAALLLLTSVFLFGEFAFGSQAVAAETVCENTEKEAADSPGQPLRSFSCSDGWRVRAYSL